MSVYYDAWADNGLEAIERGSGLRRRVKSSQTVSLQQLGIDPLRYERFTSEAPVPARETRAIVVFVGTRPGVYPNW